MVEKTKSEITYGYVPRHTTTGEEAYRKCLRCDKKFYSQSKGNRLCFFCGRKAKDVDDFGVEDRRSDGRTSRKGSPYA